MEEVRAGGREDVPIVGSNKGASMPADTGRVDAVEAVDPCGGGGNGVGHVEG